MASKPMWLERAEFLRDTWLGKLPKQIGVRKGRRFVLDPVSHARAKYMARTVEEARVLDRWLKEYHLAVAAGDDARG